MKRIFILLLVTLPTALSAQNSEKDSKLLQLINRYGQAEVTVPFTGAAAANEISKHVSVSSVRDGIVIIRLSESTAQWFISQNFRYTLKEPSEPKGMVTSSGLTEAMEWDTYPAYDQYVAIMKSFAQQYPSLCKLDTIGTTNYGKLVLALKISDNVLSNEDEPEVFYSSTIHGDETGGFILMLHLADYLLKNYPVNELVKKLVQNLEIWINPLANPDGAYRNTNVLDNAIRFNAKGYDLNRNFPDPSTPYNSGNIMQKETSDMVNFLRKHRFIISANFHSGDEVVNYPWDSWDTNDRWKSRYHADDTWFYQISRAYADTVHHYSQAGYMTGFNDGVTRGIDWYVIKGGRQDFVTWQLQGREVTIELDRNYITPPTELIRLWENNYRSLLWYLENATEGIHGHVVDSGSSSPVAARIFVGQHDKDSSHVYSDTLSGRFTRMLDAATWNLTFSAQGYRDTTLSVALGTRERKDLVVEMSRLVKVHEKAILFPNPARNEIRAVLPFTFSGPVRITVFNAVGSKVTDYEDVVYGSASLEIDISHYASGVYLIQFKNITSGQTVKDKFIVIR